MKIKLFLETSVAKKCEISIESSEDVSNEESFAEGEKLGNFFVNSLSYIQYGGLLFALRAFHDRGDLNKAAEDAAILRAAIFTKKDTDE